ncbi:hypothetical protein ACHQM5_014084 [Ranunculus cassubicifolius]
MAPGMVLTPHLEVLLDKLGSLMSREFRLLLGFNKDLEKLYEILSSIKPLLEDAERKHFKRRVTRMRICRINDAVYKAEDLLEDLEFEALLWESAIGNMTCTNQVGNYLLSARFQFKQSAICRKIGKQIHELVEWFDRFYAERNWFFTGVDNSPNVDTEETSFFLSEPIVYGRARETENIIQELLNNTYHRISICPIVGIAGVGKTTLAQLVYGDERIVANFDTRFWVCVAKDFGIKKITEVMIEHLSEKICDIGPLDLMQNHLKELLNGKKFLLVLDDVWNDDKEKWNKITLLLACGDKGSSIIVTTRLQTVVDNIAHLSSSCVINPTCDLQPLHEDDAWSLFKHYALEVGNEEDEDLIEMNEEDEDLIEIGKVIVANCNGIPRHIKQGGNLLQFKGDKFWKYARSSEFWIPEEPQESTVRSSLKLRYYSLPPIYRQCFSYCFIFPKDDEIEVEELIRLWIANDLVQTDGTIELEDAANEIFNELVLKSFFPNEEKNWLGRKIFKMQDSLHHLAWLVARTKCVALEDGDQLAEIPESIRHLLVSDGIQSSVMVETISKLFPHLRTCYFPPMYNPPLPIIFENLISLRALHLRGSNIPSLPRSIKNLKHLRYLNLSSSLNLEFLPKSICSLVYLQTLELSQCWKLQKLPKSIRKLINLTHLFLSDCRRLIQLPDGIGEMINLRHLELSECDSFTRLPDAIGQLRNLRHLDLHDCKTFSQLPDVIGQLTNLIYLDISRCPNLNGLPHGIGNLVNLRRLNLSMLLEVTHLPLLEFILGSDGGLSIRDLHRLNNLEGELLIRGLGHVKDGAEAKEANLVAKENLSSLSLVWEDSLVDDNNNSKEVIECLRPPQNLNKLVIEGYRGLAFPTWAKLLTNVVEIQFSGCSECEYLPPLGHLPLLKKLCIFGMHSLKGINKEFYGIFSSGSEAGETSKGKGFFPINDEKEAGGTIRGEGFFWEEGYNWEERQAIDDVKEAGGTSQREGFFPSLEELEFRELRNWDEWHVIDDEKVFLRLRKLRLDKCPNLALLPLPIQRSVKKFEITRCEKLMVISPPI